MSRLPPLQFQETPSWQHQRLADWIEEWSLDLELRAVLEHEAADRSPASSRPPPGQSIPGLTRPFDAPVEVGQIRLLSPRLVPDADRPMFVAIFRAWEDDLVLVAPFSRFSTPATQGEWLTGRPTPALRVLAVWNSRTLPLSRLEESWSVDVLTPLECDAAWAVFEHAISGRPLPETRALDVGPPVRHPEDPRLRYQGEENALFAYLDDLWEAAEPTLEQPPITPWPEEIFFVEEPAFAQWRKRRLGNLRRQHASLATDEQRIFCVLWEGGLSDLRHSVDKDGPAGSHDFAATALDEPQEDPDQPGHCLARWQIEDSEAVRRLRERNTFYVARGDLAGDSSHPIGRGQVRKIRESLFAVLEFGKWPDFVGAENLTLLFPGSAPR
jgi:hypothetical protein